MAAKKKPTKATKTPDTSSQRAEKQRQQRAATPKSRQAAASRGAGLKVIRVIGDHDGYQLGPASGASTRYRVMYPEISPGQGQYGGGYLTFARAGIAVQGRRNVQVGDSFTGFGEFSDNSKSRSKKKQAAFLASEKNKSSKTTAKNVKRRER